MNKRDIYNEKFQNALVDIILNIDKINVKEVFDDSCRAVDQDNKKDTLNRSPKDFSINISDIVRYSILCMENLNSDKIEENINMIKNHSSELNDSDMFIQEKNNFTTNFNKFCNALGINIANFKSGKSYVFKPKSLFVLYDILSNNSVYLHFFKNGINDKDIDSSNRIKENLYYFINHEITDQRDYEHALTNYYLYFLVDSNIEIGIKSIIIKIFTEKGITSKDKLQILEYYLDEIDDLNTEISTKIADAHVKNSTNFLENEKVSINSNLAKYITHRDTRASAPKNMLLSLILNSDLVSPKDLEEKELKYPKKITNEHHDKLIKEINKALDYYNDNNTTPSDYFYITSD